MNGKIILTWMSKKEGGTMWTRSSGLVEGRVARLVYRYKSSGSKKSRNTLSSQGIIRSSRKETDPLEDLHIGFRIILIQILKE